MKIFDFTDGKRGEELATIKVANALRGCLVSKGDVVYRIEVAEGVARKFGRDADVSWHIGATWLRWEDGEPVEDVPILPEDFGVEAICFSTGQWKVGPGEPRWQWFVLGTEDWNRKACKAGWLTFAPLAD
jgi:hypothetical protein